MTRDSRSDFSPVKVETVAPGPAGYLLEVGGGELANLLAIKLGEVVEYDAVNVPDSEWGGEHGQNITVFNTRQAHIKPLNSDLGKSSKELSYST